MRKLFLLLLLLSIPHILTGQTSHGRIVSDRLSNKSTVTITGATPDVSGGNVFQTNNGSTTAITNFLNGVDSQTITIVCGDINTSIPSNSNILVSAGTFTCSSLKSAIQFVYIASITQWIQAGGGGGGGGTSPAADAELGNNPVDNLHISVTAAVLTTVPPFLFYAAQTTGATPNSNLYLPAGFTALSGPDNNQIVAYGTFGLAGIKIATETQAFASSLGPPVSAAVLSASATDGTTPAVTLIINASGGVNSGASSNAVPAGAALYAVIMGQMTTATGAVVSSFSDTNGNVYKLAAGTGTFSNGTYGVTMWLFICASAVANAPGHSVTYSFPDTPASAGQFHVYAITHLVAGH